MKYVTISRPTVHAFAITLSSSNSNQLMLQKSKKTKSSRRKREKFEKSLLSNSRFPQKRTSKTPYAWYNDFILLDHPYSPTGTQARSGSTRRQHLHEDLEKSTCCPFINIRNKKLLVPPPKL